jgi:hypothetical protein
VSIGEDVCIAQCVIEGGVKMKKAFPGVFIVCSGLMTRGGGKPGASNGVWRRGREGRRMLLLRNKGKKKTNNQRSHAVTIDG